MTIPPSSQTQMLRPRTLADVVYGRKDRRFVGKVVLLEVETPPEAAMLAMRYAREGADLALVYPQPAEELLIVQQQIEALGCRCVLYEVDLADPWDAGLVLQSARECLGSIDIFVDRHERAHFIEDAEKLTVRGLQTRSYGAHSAA